MGLRLQRRVQQSLCCPIQGVEQVLTEHDAAAKVDLPIPPTDATDLLIQVP